jgi:hypothetical protein
MFPYLQFHLQDFIFNSENAAKGYVPWLNTGLYMRIKLWAAIKLNLN